MIFQRFSADDLPYLDILRPIDWADVKIPFRFYISHDFCFPVKLLLNDQIVGVGCTILHDDVAWLAHIIVHPDFRKQGYGSIITQQLIQQAHEKSATTIFLIATDLGAPVYSKLGFETETEYYFYKEAILQNSYTLPENIIPFEENYFDDLCRLDREISTENRMVYLRNHCRAGYLYLEQGKLIGFYMPTWGDGLILAQSEDAGIALLKLHLSQNDKVFFPEENRSAFLFMKDSSFDYFRKAKRMRLGKKRSWSAESIYNRIGGNLG
jgi:GNAT superfamily N-acetyltransferase